MEYARPLYALPTDDISPGAQWSVVGGVENAEYTASHLGNRNPAKPAKLTGTSGTWRATVGSSVLIGVALINHNFAGATVSITSGSGLNLSIPIPANGSDGLCKNPWLDVTTASLAQRTSTTFNIVITGGLLGPLALGEVVLLTALRELNLKFGAKYTPTRLLTRHRTWGGTHLQYDKKIRVRKANGMLELRDDEAAIRLLEEASIGGYHPFFFVPDEDVNDAWYVQHVPGAFSYAYDNVEITTMPFEVQEVSSGPPLYA